VQGKSLEKIIAIFMTMSRDEAQALPINHAFFILSSLSGAGASQGGRDGLEKDFEIEPQRPLIDVVHVLRDVLRDVVGYKVKG
jgi:hypothetical protein